MPFIDNLKQLFGLGTLPADAVPTPVAPTNIPAQPRTGMPPTPQLRENLYRFVVEKLAAYASETDGLPTGLTLWLLTAGVEEDDQFAVALYAGQPGHFRSELARHLADHYIKLAPDWRFSWQFVRDSLPANCTYQQGNLGLEVIRPATEKPLCVQIRALTGQTTQPSYLLDPMVQTEFRLGRGQQVQTASGRVRTNDIAFLDSGEPGFDPVQGEPNLSVSRQHATIQYDAATRRYRLLADAGGLPANGNKTKILRANETIERVDLPGVGYSLAPGDQIELGGEATLLVEVVSE